MNVTWICRITALGLALATAQSAWALDKLKVATGQRGNWDTSVGAIGSEVGIFQKHGIELDILYTQGGGETQQAVISGSTEIGIAAGIMGVISAYSKGAPVRVLGAETTGAGDLFWYVRADSPIKSLKDTAGKTIAFSTKGSSTDGIVTALMKEYNLTAKPTATGSPSSTLTQVMSGQIDVGWSAPPFGLDRLDKKEIRIIATGNDASVFKGQTVRLVIANATALQQKKDVIDRYMKAYRETVDFMYSDPKALEIFAKFNDIPVEIAKRTRDGFFPKSAIDPDKIVGLDVVMPDAVAMKYISAPLTDAQVKELIQIPPK
jgi:NitT/TauT family transport system substrate-binding protein